jgi:transposase
MHATTVAVDLAKDVFELAFADAQGRVIERKRLSRKAFARTLEQRPALRVLMEACGSAHYWGRRFQRQGHTVRLIPARDVRPYVRGNKTDRNDVAGMLEADRCASIAGVPVKTPDSRAFRRCIAFANTSRANAPLRSTCCAASCASSA